MDLVKQIAAVRDSQLGKAVLFSLRLVPAVGQFCWETIAHWWEERNAKRGVTLDVASIRQNGEPFLPDPRQHH
ncbi:hypothetical protein KKD80_00495 [Patescibacteria group bacterium]|nr:hypothetical protein [Patescibacteria group bacterium]